MTKEDIVAMAQEVGFSESEIDTCQLMLERFAALVASAERERIKQANAPEIERINAHIKQLEDAVKAEREACAKVCEEMRTYVGRNNAVTQSSAQDCAISIRARGQS